MKKRLMSAGSRVRQHGFVSIKKGTDPVNIKRAKEEIKDTIAAYLLKDEFGEYKIPAIRQRPVLLIGLQE